MDVELRRLHAFVAVARHGNFTRAARAVNISQSTLTVQIQQLETALGVRLVDRNTRSVQLTPIGRDLAPILERILRDLESALLNTQALSGLASGFVAISPLPTLSATVLPGIISACRKETPGLAIHLKDAAGIRGAAMVRTGEVDFRVRQSSGERARRNLHPSLQRSHERHLSARLALRQKRSISLADLTSRPLILMARDSSVSAVVDRAFASFGHFAPPS